MKHYHRAQDQQSTESMAEHLGIEDRRQEDRRKNISPWLGTERRKQQRRRNPYVYLQKTGDK